MIIRLLIVYMLVVIAATVSAYATPQGSLTVSPNTLTIGDPLVYSIKLTLDKTYTLVKVPDKQDFFSDGLFDLNDQRVSKNADTNYRYIYLDYELLVFGVGTQYIPTQNIVVHNPDTKVYQTVVFPPYPIYIASTKPKDATGVRLAETLYIEDKLNWSTIGIFILLCTTAIAIVGFLIYIFRRKKQASKPAMKRPVDSRPPIQKAIEELDHHYTQFSSLLLKDYYIGFTDIIKLYLGAVLSVNCVEMTSSEVLSKARNRLDEQDFRRLKRILQFCDNIKFAKFTPSPEDHLAMLNKAKDCLNQIHLHFNDTSKKEGQ